MKGLQKTLKAINYSETLEKRLVYESVVQWQPQFLGQRPYIPYYWNKYNKEGADDSGECITFLVTETDRVMFPELRKKNRVQLKTAYGRILEVK